MAGGAPAPDRTPDGPRRAGPVPAPPMVPPLLYAAVFAGGVLAILSPCILPVLPFVFAARAGAGTGARRAWRDAVPLLAGLVLAFAAVATAGTVGAAWVATAADLGRWVALAAVALAGFVLLSPRLAAWVARPAVRVGVRLEAAGAGASPGDGPQASPTRQLLLGAATGFLWAPCAGPILALVVAGAAAGARPALAASLFATFGAGAAVALVVALAAGDRVLAALRRLAGGAGEAWVRRGLGAAALAAALLVALGYDARVFAGGGLVQTAGAEEVALRRLVPDRASAEHAFDAAPAPAVRAPAVPTPDEGPLPSFDGATGWLNTPGNAALSAESLRGKVVVNVWTFACYNCLNALPRVKALAARYRGQDVVVVGVHTPELARERVPANVADAVRRLGVTYPVALDADFRVWRAFRNQYWPSVYIADRAGRVRFHHFGEGRYADEARVVQQLLAEPAPRGGAGPAASRGGA